MNDYRALHAYDAADATKYDARRFKNLRGRLVDHLEWRLLNRGVTVLAAYAGPIASVVDVPVGTGRMARRMRAKGCHVVAVDASESMLAVARGFDSADEYVVSRVEAMAIPDADCVVSVRLFGHLPDTSKALALRQFQRTATKGAVVFFARDSAWLRVRRALQKRLGRTLDCWNPVSLRQARKLAQDQHFRVLAVRGLMGPFSETHALIVATPDAVITGVRSPVCRFPWSHAQSFLGHDRLTSC